MIDATTIDVFVGGDSTAAQTVSFTIDGRTTRSAADDQDLQTPRPTPSLPTSPPASASRQSVVAVALLFAVNGLIIGGYGGALPSIRERLDHRRHPHRDPAVHRRRRRPSSRMQIGGRLSDSIGARQVALAGLPLLIAAAVTFAFADHLPGRRRRERSCSGSATAPSTSP